MNKIIVTLVYISVIIGFVNAQEKNKWPPIDVSPMDVIYYPAQVAWRNYLTQDQRKISPKIKVLYSRPQVNGRVIFGNLIAYDSEWRLGANEATSITFYQAVAIENQTIQAGTYTLSATVSETDWTIHLSTETGIWGIANRDQDQIIASIKLPSEQLNEKCEALSMTFQYIDENLCHLIIQWENTRVRLPISFNPIQFNQMDVSPLDMAHYPVNSAYTNYLNAEDKKTEPQVTIAYHRPAKKNRKIFGELVPFGKIWRLGANESTEIAIYQDASIEGINIPSGRYGMYAEVFEEYWNLILTKDIPSWGEQNRDKSMDIANIRIPVSTESEIVENLSIVLEEIDNQSMSMIIAWDKTRAKAKFVFK